MVENTSVSGNKASKAALVPISIQMGKNGMENGSTERNSDGSNDGHFHL